MASKLAPPVYSALQPINSDPRMFMSSDDTIMMTQIQATHTPDGSKIDVKPLLSIVEEIIHHCTFNVEKNLLDAKAQDEMIMQEAEEALNSMSTETMRRISWQMEGNYLNKAESHATTVSLLKFLSNYSWDAKLVLTLAAFASKQGEFWLLFQHDSSEYLQNNKNSSKHQVTKSLKTLKQAPVIIDHSRLDVVNNLIGTILDLTKCIVEFNDLPSKYITKDLPALLSTATAAIPTAVYWAIKGLVVCSAKLFNLKPTGEEFEPTSPESWNLSKLVHKTNTIYDHLKKQLSACKQHAEDKRNAEVYEALQRIFETVHIDNMKVLKAIIYAGDDQPPLLDGASKSMVNLDILRRKNVLLLISSIDISHEELSILKDIYNESRVHSYEMVWIPIVDHWVHWTEPMQKQFENLQDKMPWYSVQRPSMIEKPVMRFIKEKWHFRHKPILVVLDPQGKVLSPNAIHMMLIWKSTGFPFTSVREEALWKEESWRLELLLNDIDTTILDWIREGKYIFLYGGDDIEWIQKFTNTARSVALAAGIPLEMVYVGKSTKRKKVQGVISTITVEKLSYCWQDRTRIWYFWARLESMLFSKIHLGKADNEPMMQEIKKLLSHDKGGEWALLTKGSSVLINGHSSTVLPALLKYDVWKEHIDVKGFDQSIKEYHGMLHSETLPCCRFEFPSTVGRVPETMQCPECIRPMEKCTAFHCCHDEVL